MENQVLEELSLIKGQLVWITILLTFLIGGMAIRKVSEIVILFRTRLKDALVNISDDLFDKGKYKELVKYLEPKYKKVPNNGDIIYWLAKARLELGDIDESRLLFIRLLEVKPNWEDDYIRPYLRRIDDESGNS